MQSVFLYTKEQAQMVLEAWECPTILPSKKVIKLRLPSLIDSSFHFVEISKSLFKSTYGKPLYQFLLS